MMFSYLKLITAGLVVSLSLTQGALGSQQDDRRSDNGNGTLTVTVLYGQESKISDDQLRTMASAMLDQVKVTKERMAREQAEAKRIREFLGVKEGEKRSLWHMPGDFFKTLFQPFLEKAPRSADADSSKVIIPDENNSQKGIGSYMYDAVERVARTAWQHPTQVMAMGGSAALAYLNLGDATALIEKNVAAATLVGMLEPLVPEAIERLKVEKQKMQQEGTASYFQTRAKDIGHAMLEIVQSKTFIRAVQIGTVLYFVSSLPGVGGQWTPSLGTEYQIISSQPGSLNPGLAYCPKTGGAVITYLDSSFNVKVCGLGQSSVTTSCFTLSTAATTANGGPCVACSSDGPCMGAWTDSTGTKVLTSFFSPDTGSVIVAPTQANTAATTTAGATVCATNSDGTLQLSWTASSSGSYQYTTTTYSSTGTRQYTPVIINNNLSVQQFGTCMVPLATNPLTCLAAYDSSASGTSSVLDRLIYTNGTAIISPQTLASQTSATTLIGGPCDKFTNGNVILGMHTNAGTNPTFLTVSSTTGAAIGSTYQLPISAANLASVAGLQNGNALVIVSYNGTAYGGMFNPSGTSQCTPFQIPVTGANGQGTGPAISLGGSATSPVALSVYSDGGTGFFKARTVTFSQSSSTTTPPPTTAPATTAPATTAPGTSSPSTTLPATTAGGTTSPAPTTTHPATSSGSPAPSTTVQTSSPATTGPSSAASTLSSPISILATFGLTALYNLL